MRRIAYIPARGGSKGIANKNVVRVRGLPLIAYTIRAAQESGLFDTVFVSTDDKGIAGIAKEFGAWVPFLRDPQFARDKSKTIDAVCSDRSRLESMGKIFDSLCLLQATSPLRSADDIRGAVELFERVKEGVASVSPVAEHPILMRTQDRTGRLRHVLNCPSTIRRQELPPVYKVNGAIYVNAWTDLMKDLSFNDNPYGYVMDESRSVDIDTPDDLRKFEMILDANKDAEEPDELKAIVRSIRHVTDAVSGNGEMMPVTAERATAAVARKSIVAKRDIAVGEVFTADNLATMRPGTGISPMRWDEVVGRAAGRSFAKGEQISL